MNAGRSGRVWSRLRDEVRQTQTHCYRCGSEIDWSIPYFDGHGRLNDLAGSAEHKQPLSRFPELAEDPSNIAASHSLCNRRFANDGGHRDVTSRG